MSNCVHLEKGAIVMTSREFDIPAFLQDVGIAEARGTPPSKINNSPWETRLQMLWWYADYTKLSDSIIIRLGSGRSTHTWRDLAGYLDILRHYVKRQKEQVIGIEDSDMQSFVWYQITLGKPRGGF